MPSKTRWTPDWTGHWLWAWDQLLWIGGFWAIEYNMKQWKDKKWSIFYTEANQHCPFTLVLLWFSSPNLSSYNYSYRWFNTVLFYNVV